jgi:hypothetical protein
MTLVRTAPVKKPLALLAAAATMGVVNSRFGATV